jgi:hypothetical protein
MACAMSAQRRFMWVMLAQDLSEKKNARWSLGILSRSNPNTHTIALNALHSWGSIHFGWVAIRSS